MVRQRHHGTPAVEKALQLLEVLANSRTGQTLSDLARATGLPKSSAHRVLCTLESQGCLSRNERTGRFTFGLRLFEIATLGLHRTCLGERAWPVLYSLMGRTGLTVNMAIPEQNQAVIIEKLDGRIRLGGAIGRGKSLHCTGIGKAILAYLSDEEIAEVVRHGLQRFNENTIVSSRKLMEEVARIRQDGFSVGDEEETIGLRCIGSPILDTTGRAFAAISMAGTTEQIDNDNIAMLSREIRQSASDLARLLVTPQRAVIRQE